MAVISKIKLPSGSTYDLGTAKGAEYIRGTWTAATNAWTGVTKDQELYDGKEIVLYMPFAGTSTATTLNLTLAGGGTTGAKNVYYSSTTRHTTHFGRYSMVRMVYHKAHDINGTVYEGWWCDVDNNSNDPNYQNRVYYTARNTYTNLYRYQFCLSMEDGTVLPVNAVNNSTGTSKTLTTESFNPFGEIYYYNTTTTVNAGAGVGNATLYRQILADLRYSFNTGSTLTAKEPVYLVVTPQSDGTAKLYSDPISQALPASYDGLLYIYLGLAYDNYRIELVPVHPVYMYRNGQAVTVTQSTMETDLILTGTLAAGSSQITFSHAAIKENSTFEFFTSIWGACLSAAPVISNGRLTLTFDTQTNAMGVRVRIH